MFGFVPAIPLDSIQICKAQSKKKKKKKGKASLPVAIWFGKCRLALAATSGLELCSLVSILTCSRISVKLQKLKGLYSFSLSCLCSAFLDWMPGASAGEGKLAVCGAGLGSKVTDDFGVVLCTFPCLLSGHVKDREIPEPVAVKGTAVPS